MASWHEWPGLGWLERLALVLALLMLPLALLACCSPTPSGPATVAHEVGGVRAEILPGEVRHEEHGTVVRVQVRNTMARDLHEIKVAVQLAAPEGPVVVEQLIRSLPAHATCSVVAVLPASPRSLAPTVRIRAYQQH